jgi:hypothetical protein
MEAAAMNSTRPTAERGMAMVTAMITAAVLVTIASASLMYSRSDSMVSDNSKHGSTAIWAAQLGTEQAKNFLKTDGKWKTVGVTPEEVAPAGTTYSGLPGATYAATVAAYGATPGRFLIQAEGTAPDGSTTKIEEIVAFADDSIGLDAINIQGFGTHTALQENNIRVPKYFIDARDHDRNGRPCVTGSPYCSTFTAAALAGTEGNINTDVKPELFNLRSRMVNDGNGCNPSGSNCTGDYEAGLYWIKKHVPAFSTTSCNEGDPPPCYKALPLNIAEIHANNHTPNEAPSYTSNGGDTPWSEMFLGPIHGSPETRALADADDALLVQRIHRLLEHAVASDVSDRVALTANITSGTTTIGSWDDPKIAIICDDNPQLDPKMRRLTAEPPCNGATSPNDFKIQNVGTVFNGTGLLIVPRTLQIDDGRFNWRGIVLILDKGRFYIKNGGNPNVAGMVLGTVISQDDTGNSTKIDLIGLKQSTTVTNPFYSEPATSPAPPSYVQTIHGFGVKYSRESINNALSAGSTTLAWREVYQGEQ